MNVDTLIAAMPGLGRTTATSYLPHLEAAMREFGVTTQLRCWMALAQVGHESGSLRWMEELGTGAQYEGRCSDLGNCYPGDGRKYKGRGPIQLTGRANYLATGRALGLDLINHPEMAAQPQYAFRVSFYWWATHGLNEISDRGDVVAATRRINGGTNGLADRQSRYTRCRALGAAVLPGAAPSTPAPPPPAPPAPQQKRGAVVIFGTKTGNGYYIVGADGGVFCFGDAKFFGSVPGLRPPVTLNAPIVSGALTPSGGGYYLVAEDGGLFCFGDAKFLGSMGGKKLAAPIVSIAVAPNGTYWMEGRDGGVFAFGAPFAGSAVGKVAA